jgi:adenylate cyclase
MDVLESADVVEFAGFRLDRRAGRLSRRDETGQPASVLIGSRALELLQLLVDHHGDLVSKQTIMARVWPGTLVEESNLTTQIAALRRILDCNRTDGSCIQTVSGRGYRFILPVRRVDVGDTSDSIPTPQNNGEILSKSTPDAATTPTPPAGTPAREPAWKRWHKASLSGLALLALLALLVAGIRQGGGPANVPARLSLAVLPFQSLSDTADDEYLADGITEDLRSDLSHIPGATVVGLASANSYKGRGTALTRIGQELGVRYLIVGSIRRLGSTLRVNVQLVTTDDGITLWSDRFDEDMATIAAGQDRVVARMRSGLGISLIDVESMRSQRERPTAPDAFDLVLQARSLLNLPPSEERLNDALVLFERALAMDPDSVHALTGIAAVHIGKSMDQGRWLDPEALEHAENLLARARKIAPNAERVLVLSAAMLRSQDRCDEVIEAAERLIQLFPNSTAGYNYLGWCKMVTGHADAELPLLQRIIQLNPVDPNISGWYGRIAQDFNLLGRSEEAIAWIRRALAANPDMRVEQRGNAYRVLAVTNARMGRLDEARRWIEEGNKIRPFDTVRRYHFHGFANDAIEAQMRSIRDALRLAGLRDHADEDADFGIEPDQGLRRTLEGPTPTAVPGAITIRTSELVQFLAQRKPLIVDTGYYPTGRSLPGAVELQYSGLAGSLSDSMQGRLQRVMHDITKADLAAPIVVVGWNSERFDGPNLTLRLVSMGYKNVWWYRGGREAWEINNLAQAEPTRISW